MKKILDFPVIRQSTLDTCSCASVQACLCYYGFDHREGQIRRLMRVERNTQEVHPRKIVKILNRFGLKAGYRKLTLNDLITYIDKGVPVIINLQAWYKTKDPDYSKDNDGHYAVAVGYDAAKRRIIFSDPACFYKTYLSYTELEKRWHDGDKVDSKGNEVWDYDYMGIAVWGKKSIFSSDKIVHMD
jgi:ABC-type bacteriocin/lantibiotic exporter with double-glycine peptidase domain